MATALFMQLPPPEQPPRIVVLSSSKVGRRSALPTASACNVSRPAVILPGLGNNSEDYQPLQLTLKEYGVPSVVAKVSRIDWLRNAAGLLDPNYWKGTLRPRPVLDWYLKRVDDAVQEAMQLAQGKTLSLVGHSAGGWLARVYMEEFGMSEISLLLTLGTPHTPPPKGLLGVIDQTRGLLDYVENCCAKAVYSQELKYKQLSPLFCTDLIRCGLSLELLERCWLCSACILLSEASKTMAYIKGSRIIGNSYENPENMDPSGEDEPLAGATTVSRMAMSTSRTTALRARFIGQGYKQVCGLADVWGDGVVPEVSAHLEGALNISLDGVYHSPLGSDDLTRPWYGSPSVVDKWVNHLLHDLQLHHDASTSRAAVDAYP